MRFYLTAYIFTRNVRLGTVHKCNYLKLGCVPAWMHAWGQLGRYYYSYVVCPTCGHNRMIASTWLRASRCLQALLLKSYDLGYESYGKYFIHIMNRIYRWILGFRSECYDLILVRIPQFWQFVWVGIVVSEWLFLVIFLELSVSFFCLNIWKVI